ncbi:MAG TPA: hypothetical protein PKA63_07800 [Oligoflexia bacterium]|nr:hypothetical protein [Oligoflexia bacterium]HMP48553.1 hypothetical protein [Oligoflexia bacterium]
MKPLINKISTTETFNQSELMDEKGSSMLEMLVGLVFLSLVGLNILWSGVSATRFQKQVELGNVAMNIAISKAESLAGVFIDQLNNSYNETNEPVTSETGNIEFYRTTVVTTNPDGSRTINISVSSVDKYLPNPITYTTTFAAWES